MTSKVGFIGGGNMSTAIVKGILRNNSHASSDIWVSGPHLENLQHWVELGTNVTTENGKVLYNCDIIFLGVKPNLLEKAIEDCLKTLPEITLHRKVMLVSMLAGIKIVNLHKVLKVLSQEISVVRMLPNMPMAVGAGACLYTPDSNVTAEQCLLLEKLLSGCGVCERIQENFMDSLGALTGCGPAFMYIAIEALADGAVKQGAPRSIALKLAAQTLVGSGQMVLQSGKHPGLLKDEVCSPGGTTINGVTVLENGRLRATLINAIEAATLRSKEIGKN